MALERKLYIVGRSGSTAKAWTWDGATLSEIAALDLSYASYRACAILNGVLYIAGCGETGGADNTKGFVKSWDGSTVTTEWMGAANTFTGDLIEFGGELYLARADASIPKVYARGAGTWATVVLNPGVAGTANPPGTFCVDTKAGTKYLWFLPYNVYGTASYPWRGYNTTDGTTWTSIGAAGLASEWATLAYVFWDEFKLVWRNMMCGAAAQDEEFVTYTHPPTTAGWARETAHGHVAADQCWSDYWKDESDQVYCAPRQTKHLRKFTTAGWVNDLELCTGSDYVDVTIYKHSAFTKWGRDQYGIVNIAGTAGTRIIRRVRGAWTVVYTYVGSSYSWAGVAAEDAGGVYLVKNQVASFEVESSQIADGGICAEDFKDNAVAAAKLHAAFLLSSDKVAYIPKLVTKFYPWYRFKASASRPDIVTWRTNQQAYGFDPSTVEIVYGTFMLPEDMRPWTSASLDILWCPSTASPTGNVVWSPTALAAAEGSAFAAVTLADVTSPTGSTQYNVVKASLASITGRNARDVISLRLRRLATSGSDTYTGDAIFLGVRLNYRSTRRGT